MKCKVITGSHINSQKLKFGAGEIFDEPDWEDREDIPELLRHRIEPASVLKTRRKVPEKTTKAGATGIFEARHRGSGRYVVVNTETGEPVTEKLMSKSVAEETALEMNS